MGSEFTKNKLEIRRKPPPPALPLFVCILCNQETERDPYNPDWQKPPVCFRCAMNTPKRPQLSGVGVAHWGDFYRAHTLLCALEEETKRARRNH